MTVHNLNVNVAATPAKSKTRSTVKEDGVTLLSQVLSENPLVDDFWTLERIVSAAARLLPCSDRPALLCDVEPEFTSTPRCWDLILSAAHERGLRAR